MSGELQTKRKRGANRLNCAECRKHKLRCNKLIPCSSCVRRGRSSVCPDHTLVPGRGRSSSDMPEENWEKVSSLIDRVSSLEDALRVAHGSISSERHPLLSEELLRIKASLQDTPSHRRNDSSSSQIEGEHGPDIAGRLGSMSTDPLGKMKFYGQTASSWHFFQVNMWPLRFVDTVTWNISTQLDCAESDKYTLRQLLSKIPGAPNIALELRKIYYAQASWLHNPIPAEVFDSEIWPTFYGTGVDPSSLLDEQLALEKLSILFMILGIGTLLDSSLIPYSVDAEQYYYWAKAALFKASILEAPSLYAIQALFLMSFYLFLAERHGSCSETRWGIMGLAVKAAQAAGLHREGSLWGLDRTQIGKRRQLFWEIFTYDSWQSLTFGRPPSFPITHIDCKQPDLTDANSRNNAFHVWKHQFTSECISQLHDQAYGAKGPTYAKTMELDRMIREFPTPSILELPTLGVESSPGPCEYPDITLSLQRHVVVAICETNILYLHRSFLEKALRDYPGDTLRSPYWKSVELSFFSAQRLVAMMKNLYTQHRGPCERLWFLWTHLFSCAVILASIVTRSPALYLAPSALAQLDILYGLFSNVSANFQASQILDAMHGLQHKAHRALKDYQQGVRGRKSCSVPPSGESDHRDLEMLRGNARESSQPEYPSPTPFSTSISLPPSPEHWSSGDWESWNTIDHSPCPSVFSGLAFAESSSQWQSPAGSVASLALPASPNYTAFAAQTQSSSPFIPAQPLPYQAQNTEHLAVCAAGVGFGESLSSLFLDPMNTEPDPLTASLPQHSGTTHYPAEPTGGMTLGWPQEGLFAEPRDTSSIDFDSYSMAR
ncbi:hypothetical protein NP233_g2337 [Leucocoprinus birnbaumii]|uniref:Zn(2)-C6 fungal-type domain-containing protein n=1 Tax=Leucocoprinus birnbaumii TaxID=56174 RepID=A0AAD5YZ48_9AGAR|nr:hypothetical protein NP233_g2337 [Leucocoprinus birnbaumii]